MYLFFHFRAVIARDIPIILDLKIKKTTLVAKKFGY